MTSDEHDLERRARQPVDPSEREAIAAELMASDPLVQRAPSAVMAETLRSSRYEVIGGHETLSVELPNGVGVVHIRTGNVEGRTGDPVIAIEVVSDTLDTPAFDGRYYEEKYDSMTSTVRLIGRTEA